MAMSEHFLSSSFFCRCGFFLTVYLGGAIVKVVEFMFCCIKESIGGKNIQSAISSG